MATKKTAKAASTRKAGKTLSNLRKKNVKLTGRTRTGPVGEGATVGRSNTSPSASSEVGKARLSKQVTSGLSKDKKKVAASSKKEKEVTAKANAVRKKQKAAENSKPKPRKLSRKK